MKKGKDGFYCRYIKRLLDILCALAAMIVFCWLYAIVAILVRVKLGSPVIFKQERPGKDGKIFTLHKFRTMTDERNELGELLEDEKRLTNFGLKLRQTSLDELPEAWDILCGHLSVVGPRPLLQRDVQYMSDEQNRRHELRPGLSGLAQSSGRNSLNWDQKLEIDVEYLERVSFILDCQIILRTILKVLKREDVFFEENTDMDLKIWNEMKNQIGSIER